MTHLDTGFLIHALRPSSDADKRLRRILGAGERLAMSAIAWTEFLCGPIEAGMLERARAFIPDIVPFTRADCDASADFFNLAGRRRRTLADGMIAAVAIRSGAALATTNPKDFQRFGSALQLIVP